MRLQPANTEDLANSLRCACEQRRKVVGIDLTGINRLLEHKSEDMTASVEAGMNLSAFQQEIGRRRQWLPVDPPNMEHLTVGDLLAQNLSGPRRFGYGTVRDYLIGLKVVLADGGVIQSGGKVVKNVAGYDLAKLFIGAKGTLGVIVEATFKLRPLPARETFVMQRFGGLLEAENAINQVLDSELTPMVLDLHNMEEEAGIMAVVLGFDGSEEAVAWQSARAKEFGFSETTSLDYDKIFWSGGSAKRISVLPSRITASLSLLGQTSFVARAGNGVIYHRGAALEEKESAPTTLMHRLKKEFDPKNILSDSALAGEGQA